MISILFLAAALGQSADPTPFQTGDVNHDGVTDISDPIYLMVYLFAEGAPPSPPMAVDAEASAELFATMQWVAGAWTECQRNANMLFVEREDARAAACTYQFREAIFREFIQEMADSGSAEASSAAALLAEIPDDGWPGLCQ